MSNPTRRRVIQTTGIASVALLSPFRAKSQARKTLKIGVMTDMSGLHAEAHWSGRCARNALRHRGFRQIPSRYRRGNDVRRHVAEAGRRREHRTHLVRSGRRRCDLRYSAIRGSPRGRIDRERERQGGHFHQRRGRRSQRKILHAQPNPLDIRPVGECERYRYGVDGRRRRYLVLYPSRLYLGPRHGQRRGGRDQEGWEGGNWGAHHTHFPAPPISPARC